MKLIPPKHKDKNFVGIVQDVHEDHVLVTVINPETSRCVDVKLPHSDFTGVIKPSALRVRTDLKIGKVYQIREDDSTKGHFTFSCILTKVKITCIRYRHWTTPCIEVLYEGSTYCIPDTFVTKRKKK